MTEKPKVIPGYGLKYTIDRTGVIRFGRKPLTPRLKKYNVECVKLLTSSESYVVPIYRLLLRAFVPNPRCLSGMAEDKRLTYRGKWELEYTQRRIERTYRTQRFPPTRVVTTHDTLVDACHLRNSRTGRPIDPGQVLACLHNDQAEYLNSRWKFIT